MMAYVVGFLSEDEERVLVSRGWELEPSPRELVPSDPPTFAPDSHPSRFRMVWVDASMFEIMNGPDWEKGRAPQEEAGHATHSKPKTHK
jgi:hypothetical protein